MVRYNPKASKREERVVPPDKSEPLPKKIIWSIKERCRADYGASDVYVWKGNTYSIGQIHFNQDGIRGRIFEFNKPVSDFRIMMDGTITASNGGFGFPELFSK